jgi:hypothetical protein
MSSENINKPISFESEEDDCSDDEETESDILQSKRTKEGIEWSLFTFIGKPDSENPLECSELFITREITELMSRETN